MTSHLFMAASLAALSLIACGGQTSGAQAQALEAASGGATGDGGAGPSPCCINTATHELRPIDCVPDEVDDGTGRVAVIPLCNPFPPPGSGHDIHAP